MWRRRNGTKGSVGLEAGTCGRRWIRGWEVRRADWTFYEITVAGQGKEILPIFSFKLGRNGKKKEHLVQLTIEYRFFERIFLCGHERNNLGLLSVLLKYLFSALSEPTKS